MCLTCLCGLPNDDHGDPRNITLPVLKAAASAAGIDVGQAANSIILTMAASGAKKATEIAAIPTDVAAVRITKMAAERRYTLGLAYPAMRADRVRAADGHIDFVSQEALEKTAWEWMDRHRDVNLFHRTGTGGHAKVVESYIWRGPAWKVASPVDKSEYTIEPGDWMLGTQWDEYGWALVKAGLVNGWSPEGRAKRTTPSAARLASLRS